MSHRLGRMPVAPEVNSFQREISRHEQIVPCCRTQHRAVIANPGSNQPTSCADASVSRRPNHLPDLLDQFSLCKRHAAITIAPGASRARSRTSRLGRRSSTPTGSPVTCPMVPSGLPAFGNLKSVLPSLTGGTMFVTVNQSFTNLLTWAKYCNLLALQTSKRF